MSKVLRQKLPHLMVLSNSCPKVQSAILNNCDNSLLSLLSTCVLNAIQNPDIKLSPYCLKKLKPHKEIIRAFANPRISVQKKRRILKRTQTGGWLIPIITSLLGSAIPALIKKFTGNKET